jgi:Xaa-Pro dipeptidase
MLADYRERPSRIRAAMREAGLDALVCRLPENVLFLTGYWPRSGYGFALFPVDGDPALIVHEDEADEAANIGWALQVEPFVWAELGARPERDFARWLAGLRDERELERGTIGYEGSFEVVAPAGVPGELHVPAAPTLELLREVFPDVTLVDATDTIHTARAIKTSDEIERMRAAARVANLGLRAFRAEASPGVREYELAAIVEHAIRAGGVGADGVRIAHAWAQVTSGPRTAFANRPYMRSSERALTEGDLVMLELGVLADGFWVNLTRMATVGQLSDEATDLHRAVRDAQAAAIAAIRPGVPSSEVDTAARAILEARGYGKQFIHATGQGIGWRWHEPIPWLHPDNTDEVLEAGMVTTVGPGAYLVGAFGVRLKDSVAVRGDGHDNLTDFDREL